MNNRSLPASSRDAAKKKSTLWHFPLFALIAIFLIFIPFGGNGYWVRVITSAFMFAIMAESVNIVSGYAGYAALGNVVFFGIGAYTSAILMTKVGVPFYIALFASGIVAALFAFVLGLPVMRAKGHYFVMATLGLNELFKQVINNMDNLAGGGKGITLPIISMPPRQLYAFFYFLMLAILVATVLVTYLITKNRLGYGLRAIRANQEAAGVMGINTTLYKALAWSLSAFFTGLAGSVYANWQTFIEPPVVFDVVITVKMFVILLLGGQGTIWGPVLGAFVLELLGELIWGSFSEFHLGILGILIILVVLFMPQGLISLSRGKVSLKGLLISLKEGKI